MNHRLPFVSFVSFVSFVLLLALGLPSCGPRRVVVVRGSGGVVQYGGTRYAGPNFGSIALTTGFVPDPQGLTGTSGGQVPASSIGGGCVGWVASNPDHLMRLNTAFSFFRIFVHSSEDTTLMVLTPDGRWICDDDSGQGLNPLIEAGYWPPGDYWVWVGSYRQGVYAPYQAFFTELPQMM
ncbi:MAG: hypothetical protein K8H88_09920 [Sandaracinaceae bacterium]|nr:hypothetical protein [Sandaracinaceae bacterium]